MGFCVSVAATFAASTFVPQLNVSSTYYDLGGASASVAAGTGLSVTLTVPYIAEAGETISIKQTTSTVWFAVLQAIEFDNTSPLRSVKVLGPSSGDNALYTPSGSKNGVLVPATELGGTTQNTFGGTN